jgi:hypothetical protein
MKSTISRTVYTVQALSFGVTLEAAGSLILQRNEMGLKGIECVC